MGTREERLAATEDRLNELDVHLQALRSSIEDADITKAVLELNKAEQTLQAAQASGARLIQQTFLNFIR